VVPWAKSNHPRKRAHLHVFEGGGFPPHSFSPALVIPCRVVVCAVMERFKWEGGDKITLFRIRSYSPFRIPLWPRLANQFRSRMYGVKPHQTPDVIHPLRDARGRRTRNFIVASEGRLLSASSLIAIQWNDFGSLNQSVDQVPSMTHRMLLLSQEKLHKFVSAANVYLSNEFCDDMFRWCLKLSMTAGRATWGRSCVQRARQIGSSQHILACIVWR